MKRIPSKIKLKEIAAGAVSYLNEYGKWPDRIEELLKGRNHHGINFVGTVSRPLLTGAPLTQIVYQRPCNGGSGQISFGVASITFDEHGPSRYSSSV